MSSQVIPSEFPRQSSRLSTRIRDRLLEYSSSGNGGGGNMYDVIIQVPTMSSCSGTYPRELQGTQDLVRFVTRFRNFVDPYSTYSTFNPRTELDPLTCVLDSLIVHERDRGREREMYVSFTIAHEL